MSPMPINVTVYRCLLISPGDVQEERDAIVGAVESWNGHAGAGHSARVEIVRWEAHARPEMGAPAQDIINRQLVDDCDFGIAVFWSRLGSPTKEHASGSAEEVERLLAKSAKVMVYFSDKPIPQERLRDDQFGRLSTLRKEYETRGLLSTFPSKERLRELVSLHLTSLVGELLTKFRASKTPIASTEAVSADTTSKQQPVKIVVQAVHMQSVRGGPDGPGFLKIEVQNHSERDFFFSSISFDIGDGEFIAVSHDALTRQPIVWQKIAPGDSLAHHFQPEHWKLTAPLRNAVVYDKIGRTYSPDIFDFDDALNSHLSHGG
jgi:hypothetical protein